MCRYAGMGIGIRLKRLRREAELTQEELASRCEIAVSYLSRVENNRIDPSSKVMEKLADALEVSPGMFFDTGRTSAGRCPVSLCGTCILEQRFIAAEKPRHNIAEAYNRQILGILHTMNHVLQRNDKTVTKVLRTVVSSLYGSRRDVPSALEPLCTGACPEKG